MMPCLERHTGAWLGSWWKISSQRGRLIEAHVGGVVTEWNSQSCAISKPGFEDQLRDLVHITHPTESLWGRHTCPTGREVAHMKALGLTEGVP